MAGVEVLVQVYTGWGIQVLVLLSLAMQVTLFITAEISRRKDLMVLRVVVWWAYLMADSTATYSVGHMSVTSRSPEQQQLMALWASLLLLHLGGQDNITAYALEDVRLWLRKLQELVVQAAASAYILYESSRVGRGSLLWRASILVFVVGVVKCAEKVWALKCASANGSSEKKGQDEKREPRTEIIHMETQNSSEGLLRIAHLMLPVAGSFFGRPPKRRRVSYDYRGGHPDIPEDYDNLFTLMEMQLSLMRDVFYSKADVIHNWYGLLIRLISSTSTAATFILFHRSVHRNYGYSRVDVGVTYALLVGAVVLEATSLLRVIFSSWVSVNMWLLRPVVSPLRRLVLPERRWWWSVTIGQRNMFKLYDRSKTSRSRKIARRMKVEELWNMLVNSSRIPISRNLMQLLVKLLFEYLDEQGRGCVQAEVYTAFHTVKAEMDLHECILVWHIATQVYLSWLQDQNEARDAKQAEEQWDLMHAIKVLSNYMFFLLASRPYMLPNSAKNTHQHYSTLCGALDEIKDISTDGFFRSLHAYGSAVTSATNGDDLHRKFDLPDNETLQKGSALGSKLIDSELEGIPTDNSTQEQDFNESTPCRRLKSVATVWARMLFDASNSNNPESHSMQLSNGSEFLTVVGLLMTHLQFVHALNGKFPEKPSSGSGVAKGDLA